MQFKKRNITSCLFHKWTGYNGNSLCVTPLCQYFCIITWLYGSYKTVIHHWRYKTIIIATQIRIMPLENVTWGSKASLVLSLDTVIVTSHWNNLPFPLVQCCLTHQRAFGFLPLNSITEEGGGGRLCFDITAEIVTAAVQTNEIMWFGLCVWLCSRNFIIVYLKAQGLIAIISSTYKIFHSTFLRRCIIK